MAETALNFFKTDLRAIQFTLYEHLQVQQLFALERFAHLSREECDAVIAQCVRFVTEVTGPLNAPADRVACRLENGQVRTPTGFKAAWKKQAELGFVAFPVPQDAGGYGGPHAIHCVLQELQSGANTAFQMYPGLTHGALDLLQIWALPEDKALLPAAAARRTLRGNHVPLGAASRIRRGCGEEQGAAPRGERLRHHRHEVLDLGR